MNIFDMEVVKIREAVGTISSSLRLVGDPSERSPFDLTIHDLKQSENSLRGAADKIANIRIRLERKEEPAKTAEQCPDF